MTALEILEEALHWGMTPYKAGEYFTADFTECGSVVIAKVIYKEGRNKNPYSIIGCLYWETNITVDGPENKMCSFKERQKVLNLFKTSPDIAQLELTPVRRSGYTSGLVPTWTLEVTTHDNN